MSTHTPIIFNPVSFLQPKYEALVMKVSQLKLKVVIECLLFVEDEGGVVYTSEKQKLAKKLGIDFHIFSVSIADNPQQVFKAIDIWSKDAEITGIMVQKPTKTTWSKFNTGDNSFSHWWDSFTRLIPAQKDVDGLSPVVLAAIEDSSWKDQGFVLPATCKGVLSILDYAQKQLSRDLSSQPTAVVGRSQLLGLPLVAELKRLGWRHVDLLGKAELDALSQTQDHLKKYSTIISSTGVKGLITEEKISADCVLIDAGFPSGDIDFPSVKEKSAFITPVPNGVGPVTVYSLLENAVELCYNK